VKKHFKESPNHYKKRFYIIYYYHNYIFKTTT